MARGHTCVSDIGLLALGPFAKSLIAEQGVERERVEREVAEETICVGTLDRIQCSLHNLHHFTMRAIRHYTMCAVLGV